MGENTLTFNCNTIYSGFCCQQERGDCDKRKEQRFVPEKSQNYHHHNLDRQSSKVFAGTRELCGQELKKAAESLRAEVFQLCLCLGHGLYPCLCICHCRFPCLCFCPCICFCIISWYLSSHFSLSSSLLCGCLFFNTKLKIKICVWASSSWSDATSGPAAWETRFAGSKSGHCPHDDDCPHHYTCRHDHNGCVWRLIIVVLMVMMKVLGSAERLALGLDCDEVKLKP